jgi:UDP-N-acetylmuramate--alanine ligase
MNLKDLQSIYFLGIGGIGMSALARYFKSLGVAVSGYDKTPTALTDELIAEGIPVIFEDDVNQMPPKPDLVIYTPAIPQDHKGFNQYKSNGTPMQKRSEVLGSISTNKFAIAVAGSHGKTTVSALITHILVHAGFNTTAFLGGVCNNYRSNYVRSAGNGAAMNGEEIMVVEADEFDRSFHRLKPNMAVVTAVDTDHLDIYGSKSAIDEAFIQFAEKISDDGFLAIKSQQSIEDKLPVLDKAFYSLSDEGADVYCSKYWVVDGGYLFNLNYYGKQIRGLRLNIGGFHNIENAIAAIAIAKELKVADDVIKEALASFSGIRRRFEKKFDNGEKIFIDDYAHHPEEIRVFIESVREIYPRKKITAVFQPHLFSRTKDLAAEFATQLSKADEVILLDIYPARELPVAGVSSQLIFDQLTCAEKQLINKEKLLETIASNKQLEVLVTIGAGDIDKYVQPIAELLSRQ